jgi:purine catabolism regulator
MPLTVRELTEIPYLRTRIHAGAAGVDRPIAWAHSVEMPNPWEWLEAGDLLMTVGLGIPADAGGQVAFIESLAAIGAAGITIGEDMQAPPLTDEMFEAAERRGFPILFTAFEVPFVQVSRTVAASSQGPEHLRLVKTVRIYDSVRAAMVRSSSAAELLQGLGEEIDCTLSVCTNDRGTIIFPGSPAPAAEIRAAFLEESSRRQGAMPGILRLSVHEAPALVVPVPSRRAASLIVVPRGSEIAPYAILQHVATVAALEVERMLAAREELRRLGSETLAHMLDGRLSPISAVSQLKSHGLADGPWVMAVAARSQGPSSSGWLHHALAEREIPNMLLRRDKMLYCMVLADDATLDQLVEVFDPEETTVGISDAFAGTDALRNAVREARWALKLAQSEGRRIGRYGEQFSAAGPGSIVEARAMVDRILGPVIAYDRERGSELVQSLAVLLRCNRSWQDAASELFVHKQTLVYRMRRVEELTGRKLSHTATLAEMWLAVNALEIVGG